MRTKLCGLLVLLAAVAVPQTIRAQSLTDVARAEEARRKRVKAPAKVYTNDNLKGADQNSAPAAAGPNTAAATPASGTAAPDAGKPGPPKPPADEGPKKDEKYWKDRITLARDTLTHDKVLADALQSRVNALNHDFAGTDDPAQRAIVEQNRKTAMAEMDRINADIQKQTKAVSDIQEEARKANVPAGWLR